MTATAQSSATEKPSAADQPPALEKAVAALPVPGFEQVKNAVETAKKAGIHYTIRALIAGQTLLEYRAAVNYKSHGGTVKVNKNKSSSEVKRGFDDVLESLSIARTTGYRWMEAAQRVAGAVWPHRPPALQDNGLVQIGGSLVRISALIDPASDSASEAEADERDRYFALIADKTLKDCLRGIIIDGNDAHAFTRAHNGQRANGAGFNGKSRKDFATFMAGHAKLLFGHASHWENMPQPDRTRALAGMMAHAEKAPFEFLDVYCEHLLAVRRDRREKLKQSNQL